MKRIITTISGSLALLAATAICTVSATQAAAKPGFVPGTWNGNGTISGSSVDGPMSTRFSGSMQFKLQVTGSTAVKGSGAWKLTMKGSGPVGSVMTGTANLTFSGTPTDIRYTGMQVVAGKVSDGTHTSPIRFSKKISGRLVVTRAGACRVLGGSPMSGGVKLTWTALLAGAGTCNA
jgi:hypothetical protein